MKYEPIATVRESSDWPMIAAVAIIASIVILYKLGTPPVYWWDEGRVAVNSLEMMHSSNPLVVTYKGLPDLWNTKPPLAIWLNALSMRLFGVNEFALRLPAALAAVGTTIAVAVFTRRYSDRITGFLGAMILLGCGGFLEVHVARTADFDSLLVLFTTLTVFCVAERRFRSGAVFLGLALLTKGPAALLILPGFIALGKEARRFVIPAGLAVMTFLLFLAARELAAPGYLEASYLYDVARFGVPADGHHGSWYFYLFRLMFPWSLVFSVHLIDVVYVSSAFPWPLIALFAMRKPRVQATNMVLFTLVGLLIILTLAATKLGWYAAPAYPLIATLAAVGTYRVGPKYSLYVLPLAFFCIGMNIWKIEVEQATSTTSESQRLQSIVRSLNYPNMVFLRDYRWPRNFSYDGPLEFYAQIKGARIRDGLIYTPRPGEVLVGCDLDYAWRPIRQDKHCAAYRVPLNPSRAGD